MRISISILDAILTSKGESKGFFKHQTLTYSIPNVDIDNEPFPNDTISLIKSFIILVIGNLAQHTTSLLLCERIFLNRASSMIRIDCIIYNDIRFATWLLLFSDNIKLFVHSNNNWNIYLIRVPAPNVISISKIAIHIQIITQCNNRYNATMAHNIMRIGCIIIVKHEK